MGQFDLVVRNVRRALEDHDSGKLPELTPPVAIALIRILTDMLEACNAERLERPDEAYLLHLLGLHAACAAEGQRKRFMTPSAN